MPGLRLGARKQAPDIARPAQVGLIAHLRLKRSTPQVPPTQVALLRGPVGAGPGEIRRGGLGWGMMEAEPAPDLSMMLRELLAPFCLDNEPLPGTPTQQAPRAPRCLTPTGRCVKEPPLPPSWPSGQGVMTSGFWGYSGATILVTDTYKEEVLVPRGTWGHMWLEVMRFPMPRVPQAYVVPPRKGVATHTTPCSQVLLACTPGFRHCPALPSRERGPGPAPCWGHPGPGPLLGAEGPWGAGTPTSGQGCQGHADSSQPAT